MPHQVVRYKTSQGYTQELESGEPVSAGVATWEEAEKIRTEWREADQDNYYNIVYFASAKLVEKKSR